MPSIQKHPSDIATKPNPLLSVVAEPPPRTSGDPSDVDTEPSVFIDEVLKQIEPSASDPKTHCIMMASSVAQLRNAIVEYSQSVDGMFDVQIIGHGQSGYLELGQSWRSSSSYFDGREYWRLNSNPDLLNILRLKGVSDRFGKVTLAACQVGSEKPRSQAVNGSTLLYSLDQLWNPQGRATPCQVRGASANVDFPMFKADTGVFAGPMRTWDDAPIDAPIIPLFMKFTEASVSGTRFRELVLPDATRKRIPYHLNQRLQAAYVRERVDRRGPALAAPRFEFLIEVTDKKKRVDGRARISTDGASLTIELPEPLPEAERAHFTQIGARFYRYYYALEDFRGSALLDLLVSKLANLADGGDSSS